MLHEAAEGGEVGEAVRCVRRRGGACGREGAHGEGEDDPLAAAEGPVHDHVRHGRLGEGGAGVCGEGRGVCGGVVEGDVLADNVGEVLPMDTET